MRCCIVGPEDAARHSQTDTKTACVLQSGDIKFRVMQYLRPPDAEA